MEIEIYEDNIVKAWHKKDDLNYFHREDGPAEILKHRNKCWMEFWWYYNVHYDAPRKMPLNLFISYCKWEYNKNGN